ncbi:hypothetical protein ABZV75_22875 [Streptomyces flaveolus]|uniref:hypothetical protein n=1 Tax=Streptomyces flaveolus TaxID=67297 RepID=UPI0033A5DCD1
MRRRRTARRDGPKARSSQRCRHSGAAWWSSDAVTLAGGPGPDQADIETEPLRSRLPVGAGRLALAGALVAGAVLFQDSVLADAAAPAAPWSPRKRSFII